MTLEKTLPAEGESSAGRTTEGAKEEGTSVSDAFHKLTQWYTTGSPLSSQNATGREAIIRDLMEQAAVRFKVTAQAAVRNLEEANRHRAVYVALAELLKEEGGCR